LGSKAAKGVFIKNRLGERGQGRKGEKTPLLPCSPAFFPHKGIDKNKRTKHSPKQ
jgi:hypothetical protein